VMSRTLSLVRKEIEYWRGFLYEDLHCLCFSADIIEMILSSGLRLLWNAEYIKEKRNPYKLWFDIVRNDTVGRPRRMS